MHFVICTEEGKVKFSFSISHIWYYYHHTSGTKIAGTVVLLQLHFCGQDSRIVVFCVFYSDTQGWRLNHNSVSIALLLQ